MVLFALVCVSSKLRPYIARADNSSRQRRLAVAVFPERKISPSVCVVQCVHFFNIYVQVHIVGITDQWDGAHKFSARQRPILLFLGICSNCFVSKSTREVCTPEEKANNHCDC